MNSDTAPDKHDYMRGHDYLNALFAGKYFILIVMVICMALTAIYSYSHIPKSQVSIVIKPGVYIGEGGAITPILKPQGFVNLINQGSFDGLIQRSLRIDPPRPMRFKAVNPDDTDIINVTYETGNVSQGLSVLKELITQLMNYYDKERVLKLETVSYKSIGALKKELSNLEMNKAKRTDEKRILIQGTNKEREIGQEGKEIENLNLEIIGLRKQIAHLDMIMKQGASLTIIQEPMIVSSDFSGKFFNNILVAGVLSLVFVVLIQFIIYDFKMGRRLKS